MCRMYNYYELDNRCMINMHMINIYMLLAIYVQYVYTCTTHIVLLTPLSLSVMMGVGCPQFVRSSILKMMSSISSVLLTPLVSSIPDM